MAVAAATSALVLGSTAAAWADYDTTGTVSSRTYQGSSGVSGVYKSYTMTAGGNQFCVRSSSLSSNDPIDASQFTRVFIVSGGTQSFGGYGSIANGNTVKARVNESASPTYCNGKKLAYMVWVYL
jgi:hypothetical protein